MAIRFTSLSLAVSTLACLAGTTLAQNSAVGSADLIVTFQNPGGTTGASAVLTGIAGTTGTSGTARIFTLRELRNTAPGSFTVLTDLGPALATAFGNTWFDAPTLYMAGMVNTGTSGSQTAITSGDAQRTVYFTRARDTIGTVGEANSIGVTNPNSSFYTQVSSGINTLKNGLEQGPGTGANNTPIFQSTTTVSNIDDALGFISGTSNQAPAFNQIADGIQDNFGAGSLGTFGLAGSIELALDLYRMQPGILDSGSANPNVTGVTGVSEFLGTLTITQAGILGFTAAVPEPSTALLFGGMAVVFAGSFRRRKVAH